MDLVTCIAQGCLNSCYSENKLKLMGTILKFLGRTEVKNNRPGDSLQRLPLFPCLCKQGFLDQLRLGSLKERISPGRCEKSPQYHYSWTLFLHWSSSCSHHKTPLPLPRQLLLPKHGGSCRLSTEPGCSSAGGITWGFSRLLLSTGSAQVGPTLSFSPSREATLDFQQINLQPNRSLLLSQTQMPKRSLTQSPLVG